MNKITFIGFLLKKKKDNDPVCSEARFLLFYFSR